MTRINLAIIGCGGIVRSVHAAHLASIPTIHVRACMDLVEANARQIATQVGAEYHTTDLQRVLTDDAVDAVLIATLAETHVAISMQAATAGKAVFSEKPMGCEVEECQRLMQCLEQTKVPYMTGYCYRFNKAVTRIQPLIQPGFSWVHVIAPSENPGIYYGWINNLCHALDLVRVFHRCEPVEIRAEGDGPPALQIDTRNQGRLAVTVRFQDQSLAVIALGQQNPSLFMGKWYYKFCGANGRTAEIVNYRRATFHTLDPQENVDYADETIYHSGHRMELEMFADCLLQHQPMPISIRDAFMVNVMMAAVKRSYESSQPVSIADIAQ